MGLLAEAAATAAAEAAAAACWRSVLEGGGVRGFGHKDEAP